MRIRQFGPIRIEWPGKDNSPSPPKGYVYIIYDQVKTSSLFHIQIRIPKEESIPRLLAQCTHDRANGGSWYYRLSSHRARSKEVTLSSFYYNINKCWHRCRSFPGCSLTRTTCQSGCNGWTLGKLSLSAPCTGCSMQRAWPPFLETYLEVSSLHNTENAVTLYTGGFTKAAVPDQA